MRITIAGAGAFGTALAIALAANGPVTLWPRDADQARVMSRARRNDRRLPGIDIPENVTISAGIETISDAETILLAMPAQILRGWLTDHAADLDGRTLVACCKGIDLQTLTGPAASIRAAVPGATPAILTGPSFAADIARGLPTALTLACADDDTGAALQTALSTPTLRLYRTTDTIGAELGGALKNVIAIACGVCIGAGFGESARAALMTRGFAEMARIGAVLGARTETLAGLSGFGDLALTCTSDQSRNYRFGLSIGRCEDFDPAITVEGAATARAITALAREHGLDLPISTIVTRLSSGEIDSKSALNQLLSRPLKEE